MKVSYLLKASCRMFSNSSASEIVSEHILNVPILLIKGTWPTNSLHQEHLPSAESPYTQDRHHESFQHHYVLGVVLLQERA